MDEIPMEKKQKVAAEFTIRLPEDVAKELKEKCREAGVKKNEMVVRCLRAALAAVKVK